MRSKAQLTAWAVLLVAMAVAVVGAIIYQSNPIMAQESGGSSEVESENYPRRIPPGPGAQEVRLLPI